MSCPLCGCAASSESTFGCVYQGRNFDYRRCSGCRSLYCDPMPDADTLAKMYSVEYGAAVGHSEMQGIEDPKEPGRCTAWLAKVAEGTFVDYGCGAGTLLTAAAKLHWQAVGVELDPDVAQQTQKITGYRVLTASEASSLASPLADVLHLGDVIEHLTELDRQMPEILRLLKPGGVLLAQGPLEGNFNLFAASCELSHRLRPWHRTQMAPYHVLLATAKGQRKCFERFGLRELEYAIHEVVWPAPARLTGSDLLRPRAVALFSLRKLSLMLSALNRSHWGNRYFYAGRWPQKEI